MTSRFETMDGRLFTRQGISWLTPCLVNRDIMKRYIFAAMILRMTSDVPAPSVPSLASR